MDDTRPEAARVMREAYRRMTPAQKIRRAMDLTMAADQLARTRLRTLHPKASERELTLRLGALKFGAETMRRVFGWEDGGTG